MSSNLSYLNLTAFSAMPVVCWQALPVSTISTREILTALSVLVVIACLAFAAAFLTASGRKNSKPRKKRTGRLPSEAVAEETTEEETTSMPFETTAAAGVAGAKEITVDQDLEKAAPSQPLAQESAQAEPATWTALPQPAMIQAPQAPAPPAPATTEMTAGPAEVAQRPEEKRRGKQTPPKPVSQAAPKKEPSVGPPLVARLEISELNIRPAEARPGETVVISFRATNLSPVQSYYSATLRVNGQVSAIKGISMLGKASLPMSFAVVRSLPGNYRVEVNDLAGKFTVS